MKNIACLTLAFFLISILSVSGSIAKEAGSGAIVRVLIVDDKDVLILSLKGKYKIYAINSDRILSEGPYLTAKVRPTKEGLQIGAKEINVYGAKVKVAKDSNIYVDSRRFRGDIDIVKKDNGKLMVINYINMEEYLYGVLYHEVSHRWPMGALKAQAIAARTFALYQIRQNTLQPYDMRCDIYSQVYGGRTSEKWSTTRAVNLTKSTVLVYNGDIFPTYYHATCAGHTEDAANLWNIDLVPLKGVACNFCGSSPHYRWKKDIPLWALENKLKDGGYKLGHIASVVIISTNKSGRVDKLEIKDDAGVSIILTGKDFRQIIGPNEVRSTKFSASIKWSHLILDGMGWGHGAGMCQWGAYGMSRKGKSAEEILKYYYPGAEITTIDKITKQ